MGRFVALSHWWRSSDKHNFYTYRCNLAAQQAGIRPSDLPKRFQDTATVTRELGVRCLWMDSISIVQPRHEATADCPDGRSQDDNWRSECGKVSEYFDSAYCTLAATSVTNPAEDEGILEPGPLVAAKTPVFPPEKCDLEGLVPTRLRPAPFIKPGGEPRWWLILLRRLREPRGEGQLLAVIRAAFAPDAHLAVRCAWVK